MPRALIALTLLSAVVACDRRASESMVAQSVARPAGSAAAVAHETPTARVVFLGDSLTAGFGLDERQAFPALLEGDLRRRGWRVEVINGGVSGDTTAGGAARLSWLLRQSPDVVVVELGVNDGLRGQPLENIVVNLRDIVSRSLGSGARVLLLGMRIPPNYGADYASRFEGIYRQLAAELEVPLMPFLLEGVGGLAELNLPDGIHPNAEGHRIVARSVLPHLEEVLESLPPGFRDEEAE
jgi:acyl-CoA thioesterase-1